jgi:hypothetical protein
MGQKLRLSIYWKNIIDATVLTEDAKKRNCFYSQDTTRR